MRHKKYLLLLLLPLYSNADTSNTVLVPGVTLHPPIPQYVFAGLTFSGYASGSYNYLSQSPEFTSGYPDRLYDINENGFTLQQISITLARQPDEGLGAVINPTLGSDANRMYANGMKPWSDSDNLAFDLTQAYLQFNTHHFTVIGGKFYGLAGYESIPPQNSNFSSSYIATYAEPTTVTGIRGTYSITANTNVAIGINDGWDNVRDWGRGKTLELGAWYSDAKQSFSAYLYNGQERASLFANSGPIGNRTLLDLIALVKATEKLTFVANYDFVAQNHALLPNGNFSRATWQGIAGYVQYQINPRWRLSFRGEYFMDANGFVTGIPQHLKELTITVGYLIMKQMELRAETRRDIASTNSFQGKNGISTSNNMQSFALNAVVTF